MTFPPIRTETYYKNIDLAKNILFHARIHPLTTEERITYGGTLTSGDDGIIVYDKDVKSFFGWNGTEWSVVGSEQIQSDWNQSNNTQVDYIKNKPNLFTTIYPTGLIPFGDGSTIGGITNSNLSYNPTSYFNLQVTGTNEDSGFWSSTSNSGLWSENDTNWSVLQVYTSGAYFQYNGSNGLFGVTLQNEGLQFTNFNNTWLWSHTDGTSGQVLKTDGNGNLSFDNISTSNITGLSIVATSGSYLDLTNRPTDLGDFTNDPGFLTTISGIYAGGDLNGTYSSPSVVALLGNEIPSNALGYLHNDGNGILSWGDVSFSNTLNQTLSYGNTTSGYDIKLTSNDSILIESNGSKLTKGLNDNSTGGNYGISLICSIGYEFNWQGGVLTSYNGNTIIPLRIASNLILPIGGSISADDYNVNYNQPGAFTIKGSNGAIGGTSVGGGDLILQGGSSYTGEGQTAGDVIIKGGINNYEPGPLNGGYVRIFTGGAERVIIDNDGGTIFNTSVTANTFVTSGGLSSQFLKGDGSLDSNTYLTSFTETDPIYTASSWYSTTNNATNWNTAYGWGNHASVGYLLSSTAAATYQTKLSGTGIVKSVSGTISYLTDNSTNWDTAYTDRNKWDGGSTGLTASTGRTSLGLGTFAVKDYPTWSSGTPFVKMTAAGTFSLDTNTYLTSAALSTLTDVTITSPTNNQILQYNSGSSKWVNASLSVSASGSNGYIQFNNSGSLGSSGNLFWDNTNNALFLNTSNPASTTQYTKIYTNSTQGLILDIKYPGIFGNYTFNNGGGITYLDYGTSGKILFNIASTIGAAGFSSNRGNGGEYLPLLLYSNYYPMSTTTPAASLIVYKSDGGGISVPKIDVFNGEYGNIILNRGGGNTSIGNTYTVPSLFQVYQSTLGVGTVTTSGTTVVGTNTQFTNTFKIGDVIYLGTPSTVWNNSTTYTAGQAVTNGSNTYLVTIGGTGGTGPTGTSTTPQQFGGSGPTFVIGNFTITAVTDDNHLTTGNLPTIASGVAYSLVGGSRFNVYGKGDIVFGSTSKLWYDARYGILSINSSTSGSSVNSNIKMYVNGYLGIGDPSLSQYSYIYSTTGPSILYFYNGGVGGNATMSFNQNGVLTVPGSVTTPSITATSLNTSLAGDFLNSNAGGVTDVPILRVSNSLISGSAINVNQVKLGCSFNNTLTANEPTGFSYGMYWNMICYNTTTASRYNQNTVQLNSLWVANGVANPISAFTIKAYSVTNGLIEVGRFTGNGNLLVGTTTDDTINRLQVSGRTILLGQVSYGGSTPTIAAGAGAGSTGSPSVSIVGTNNGGVITVNTGAISATGIVVTVTYTAAFATGSQIILYPTNAATALLSGVSMVYTSGTTTTFTITSGTTALTAATTYTWSYHVTGY